MVLVLSFVYSFFLLSPSLFIHLFYFLALCTSLFFPSPPSVMSSIPSFLPVLFVLPPAPCVLYPGRRAGHGLLLRDLGGKWLGSQPASTRGEPLQCVSEDSQVDPDRPSTDHFGCPSVFSPSSIFSPPVSVFSYFSWLNLGLLKPRCH